MTWKITTRPTSRNLVAFTWMAQRSDGEGVLLGEETYPTSALALTVAKRAVDEYETNQAIVAGATVEISDYVPEIGA